MTRLLAVIAAPVLPRRVSIDSPDFEVSGPELMETSKLVLLLLLLIVCVSLVQENLGGTF